MRKRILCVFVVSVLLIVTNVSTSILTTSISDAKWENSLLASINANIREFTIRGNAEYITRSMDFTVEVRQFSK